MMNIRKYSLDKWHIILGLNSIINDTLNLFDVCYYITIPYEKFTSYQNNNNNNNIHIKFFIENK